ncbi:hypothetical protein [Nitrospira japonica]|nr:hypothetical protein [Nitrospira japonica]
MTKRILALYACVVLGLGVGCTAVAPNGPEEYPAQKALIGKTRQELLACAGKPVSERAGGERPAVIYYREASQLEESFPGSKSSFAKVHHGCRATIVLDQDRVADVRYESDPSSYQDEDHCEEIFDRCVNP